MALPTDIQTGTATGKYTRSDGTPEQGTVTFTPAAAYVVSPNTKTTVTMYPVTVSLAADGTFTATLVASGDPDMVPTNWTWKASVNLNGGPTITTQTFVLNPGQTLDITAITTVQTNLGTAPAIGGGGVSSWNDLQDKPAFIGAGADAATARAAIGAGTSNLTLGSSATTAKAGNWLPDYSTDVQGKPATFPPSAHTHTPSDVGASTFGASLISAVNASAGRTALGATTTGAALFTAADQAAAQTTLGVQALIDAAVALIRSNDLAATPIMSYDVGGTYTVTSSTRPILYCGQTVPPALKSTDRWISS